MSLPLAKASHLKDGREVVNENKGLVDRITVGAGVGVHLIEP